MVILNCISLPYSKTITRIQDSIVSDFTIPNPGMDNIDTGIISYAISKAMFDLVLDIMVGMWGQCSETLVVVFSSWCRLGPLASSQLNCVKG